MNEFTVWVASAAAISFGLSWLLHWVDLRLLGGMVAVFSVVTMAMLVVMGLDEIIQFIAMSMGF